MPERFFLLASGDINQHYLRTYCLLFYPGCKFADRNSFRDIPPGEPYIYAATGLRSGAVQSAYVEIFDGAETFSEFCSVPLRDGLDPQTSDNPRPSAAIRAVAYAFFAAASRHTGLRPPWGVHTGIRPAKVSAAYLAAYGAQAGAMIQRDYLIEPRRAALVLECNRHAEPTARSVGDSRREFSLYVSVPFCPSRCSYCSFISYPSGKFKGLIYEYAGLLNKELAALGQLTRELGMRLRTVYIGGGTPTSFDAGMLGALFGAVESAFDLSALEEYTCECGRADTIDREKLAAIRAAGVNRISINPQSTDDGVLRAIGRRHTAEDFFRAAELASKFDFETINADIIAGLPGDTARTFERTVRDVLALGFGNITVHTFCVKNASLCRRDDGADIYRAGDGLARECVDMAADMLHAAGYAPYYMYKQRYTAGNLENTGYYNTGTSSPCAYNIYMMEELHTVLAAGAGAVSKIVRARDGLIRRMYACKYPLEYTNRPPLALDAKSAAQLREWLTD